MSFAPQLSIIMPAYNAEKFIGESIDSVLQQTFPDFELIVINDGSTDRTSNVVRSYSDPRIKLIEQGNGGVASARNNGLSHASGEFIAFLDSDDLWVDAKIEKQLSVFRRCHDIGLVYTETYCFSDNTAEAYYLPYRESTPFHDPYLRLLTHDYIPTLSVMIRRSVLNTVEPMGFDNRLFGTEDWDLWIRIAEKYKIHHLNETLCYYRLNPDGISKNFGRHHSEEFAVIKRHVLSNGGINPLVKKYSLFFWEKKLLINLLKSKKLLSFVFRGIWIAFKYGLYFTLMQVIFMYSLRKSIEK